MAITFPSPVADGYSFTAENGVVYTFDSSGGGGWYAYHPDGLNDVYVNIDGDTMTGDLTVPSLNEGPLAGFRNQLINGNFLVNQRAQLSGDVPNQTFVFDRWQIRRFAGGTVNFSQEFSSALGCYVCQLAITGMTGYTGIMQTIEAENVRSLNGKQVTVSVLATQAPNVTIGVFDNTNSVTNLVNGVAMTDEGVVAGSFRKYSHTFTLTSATDFIGQSQTSGGVRVIFHLGTDAAPPADQTVQFAQAMFEPGSVATPFEHRPIGVEFGLCQRYYIASQFAIQGNAINGGIVANWIQFPTLMRDTPTAVISQITKFPSNIQDPVVSTTHNNGIRIGVTNNTGANQTNIAIGSAYTVDAEF